MDPELQALFSRLGSMTEPLTDDELAGLDDQIVAMVDDIDPATGTDDDLAMMVEAREWAARIRTEQATRQTAAEERTRRIAELRAEIVPPAEGEEIPVEVEDPEVAEVVAEVEVEAPVAEVVEVAEPLAAAGQPVIVPGPPASSLPRISRLAARRPERNRPRLTATRSRFGVEAPTLTAAADLPGLTSGSTVDAESWARACMRRFDAITRMDNGGSDGEKIYFGSRHVEYPDDRMLTDDDVSNEEKINAVTSPQALAASGGICAPVAVDYNLSTIAQSARPVKAALATFGATRGGIRYVLPHTLAQVTADGPASVWTEANDIALNAPATKPHSVFTCQGVHEDYVDAITSITQFGNFQSRYFPEQVQQYLDTVDAVHARLAEATILAALTAGSTKVTHDAGILGATREILPTIDLAAAAYRYRHRMAPESMLRFIIPEWLEDMIRADLAREMPGDSGSTIERLATADAEIDRFFTVRNINVSYTQDSATGATVTQGWGVQNAGQLNPWPLHTYCWLFHEGAWMVLDGGELNLGMVRDSTLNRTNDYQMFAETFEKAVFRGHESLALDLTLAPTGESSGAAVVGSYYLGGS